jgi:hypothetical protein
MRSSIVARIVPVLLLVLTGTSCSRTYWTRPGYASPWSLKCRETCEIMRDAGCYESCAKAR